jgi:drug/metabolite transporter (DMT)-like permease
MATSGAPDRRRARLEVLGAAVLFSTGGAAIKGTALTAWQVAGVRSLVAALALLILLPEARRHWRARSVLVGTFYAATLVLFVLANKLTTAANAIYLQAVGPLVVMVLAPLVLAEHVRRQDVPFVVAMGAGLALVFAGQQQPLATAPNPFAGNLAGAASGLTWGFTIVGLRWMGSRDQDATLNCIVIGNLIAALACLPAGWPIHASVHDWVTLLWLGVFQIGMAYTLLTRGVRHVTALDASLLLLAEPVLNPLWAWMVHGERPTAWALAGGAVILAASVARTLQAKD